MEYLKGVFVSSLQIGRNVPKLPPIGRDDFDVTQRLGEVGLRAEERREREKRVRRNED